MKILHYVDENRLTWGEAWIQLLKELAAQGMQNHVACKSGGTLSARLAEEGIPFSSVDTPAAWLPWGLGRIIDNTGPDIIHTRLSSAARIAGFWGRRKKVPVVQSVDKFSKARYYRNADFLLPCSFAVKRHMLSLGFPESKMRVVFNPLDVARYKPDPAVRAAKRAELGLDGELLITGAGRLDFGKGFDVLVAAYAEYLEKVPAARAESKLLLVGDGEEKPKLLRLIRELGIEGNTILPGFVSDVRPYLQATEIFVMPSRMPEGFGIVLLEAMASGAACIATRCGGVLDIIVDGETGWLVDMDNVSSLSAALIFAAENKAARETVALAGLNRAQLFDIGKIAWQVISVYEDVLDAGF